MSAADGDEDAWLYGEEEEQAAPPPGEGAGGEGAPPPASTDENTTADQTEENGETNEGQENIPPVPEGDDDDDSDDDIEITIDKDKIEAAKTSYQNMQMKKAGHEFSKEKKGKFAVEEFDQIGTINGESAVELNIEDLEEKPWRKPGADITDYFNYGFTEDTWTAYCNRQKSLRGNEAGVPVLPSAPILTNNKTSNSGPLSLSSIPILGGGDLAAKMNNTSGKQKIISTLKQVEAKPQEPSGITVMTHDKRIYSNKVLSNMDFSVPPPGAGFTVPPPAVLGSEPPPSNSAAAAAGTTSLPAAADTFSAADFPTGEFPPAEAFGEDPYAGGFNEPTAEAQWNVPPPHHYNTSLPPPTIPSHTGHHDPYSSDPRYRVRDSERYSDRVGEGSGGRGGADPSSDRGGGGYARDYDRDRRSSRRRSRSRDRDRDRRDRDRDRDRDRYFDRTRVKRERRSRSRSRSPRSSHKKSRSDRSDRSDRKRDSADRTEEQVKIKEEPEDSGPVAPPGEN